VLKLEFCCKVNPIEGEGQETITLLPECVTVRSGEPAVWTTEIRLQKPPVSE